VAISVFYTCTIIAEVNASKSLPYASEIVTLHTSCLVFSSD